MLDSSAMILRIMRQFHSAHLVLAIFGVLSLTCHSYGSNEVWALIAFREVVYDDPKQAMSSWNALDSDPCEWAGISCSDSGDHVIKLNVSDSSLKGFIAPQLGLLGYLQELILHGNKLMGIIPKEIGMLKSLKVLDLGANQLSGPIPCEIGNLANLVKINLRSNELTGSLPPEIGNLDKLQELLLDRNKLHGTLPAQNSTKSASNLNGMYASTTNITGFCHSSNLKAADFSYNFLSGTIPECLQYLPSASFQGNCLQEKGVKQRPNAQCGGVPSAPRKGHPPQDQKQRHEHRGDKRPGQSKPAWVLALEIVTGIMVGTLFVVAILITLQRCKSKSSMIIPWKKSGSGKDQLTEYVGEHYSEMLKDVLRFSRQELEVACEDFSNIIGSSPDSVVYKGTLKGVSEIAVISFCIKEEKWTCYHELYFQREVAELSRLNHENVGKMLGYCRENSPFTRMLVFEYASNGTLYENLHYGDDGCQLSWTRRMKIIIGIARGLKYLHSELDPPFTMSELNSSSVYLTDDFLSKLVDFETWKTILARSDKNSCSIGSNGSVCVLANSVEDRRLDVQGNVYAFGVLLLEIVSGRPPFCKDKGYLVEWAKNYLGQHDMMSQVVDPEVKHFHEDDLKVLCEVANLCVNREPSSSPSSMRDLCGMLEAGIDLSVSAELRSSSLAWAELALSS